MKLGALGGRAVGATVAAFALVCAAMLAGPGVTVTNVYVNDLLIFLDGAHRIASGQVPNRDFHTALGPLTYYIPAAGYWLTGRLGAAMPVGMALTAVAFAPVVAHVVASRLRPAIAIPFGIFIVLVVAVPMNLGESIASLSFAMFYNRVGWAALALLLAMYVRPTRPSDALDAMCAAALTSAMLYTKVTYGAVAVAFLIFMAFDREQRGWAVAAMALTAVAALVVEAFWRASAAHFSDLMMTAQVSGTRGFVDLAIGFLRHLADYVMFAILAVLALWRTRRLRDFLFFGFCAGPGLMIMNQNSQPWGILTIHAGAAVAAELLVRREPAPASTGTSGWTAGAPLALLALLLPTAAHCLAALTLHTGLALARAGESFPMPNFKDIRLVELWSPGDVPFSRAYLASLGDGARALQMLPETPTRVSVLDFVSPFSAGLGLKPPKGDWSWLHWGRNVNAAAHLPGDELLGGVEILMLPKWGINNLPLRDLYRPDISELFEPIGDTALWTIHRRRAEPLRGSL